MANGYLGSESVLTSTYNQEVVPQAPDGWTQPRYIFYKFSFINKDACRVSINGGKPIYLEENQGFESSHMDAKINSFVIIEDNISYNWIGAY